MLMPLFEKKYAGYLTAYKIPLAPDQLDPTVFYTPEEGGDPKLLPSIHSQIARDLETLTGTDQPYRIKGYYLVGSALLPGNKHKNDDLKVIIQINNDIKDTEADGARAEAILTMASKLSNRKAIGTCRNIIYVPTVRSIKDQNYEGIYDIYAHSWLKQPNGG